MNHTPSPATRPVVTIQPTDDNGRFHMTFDSRPLPSPVTAGDLGRALSTITARVGSPVTVNVHTADGRVLSDTISPPATGLDDPNQARRFWPGEPVWTAAWIGQTHADWHGHTTPDMPRWARKASHILLIGGQSKIIRYQPTR